MSKRSKNTQHQPLWMPFADVYMLNVNIEDPIFNTYFFSRIEPSGLKHASLSLYTHQEAVIKLFYRYYQYLLLIIAAIQKSYPSMYYKAATRRSLSLLTIIMLKLPVRHFRSISKKCVICANVDTVIWSWYVMITFSSS